MIGRCDSPFTSATDATSYRFRVTLSNPFTPRSHSTTSELPCDKMYSALISKSSTVALIPRLSSTGLRVRPTSVSSTKFCMFRAPI